MCCYLSEPTMKNILKFVIPHITAKCDDLAYMMNYGPNDVETFKKDSQNVEECSKKMFINWLTSGHDPNPKTYQNLLNYIKEVNDLIVASEKIEEQLILGKAIKHDII